MRNADLKRYVKLHWAIKAKEGEIDELKAKLEEIAEKLIPNMVGAGVKRTTLDGSTVRVGRMVRASAGGNMRELVRAMKEAAADDPALAVMVSETINGNTLSAWVRERDPENELSPEEIVAQLPAPVRAAIRVTEKWEIHCTKA